MPVEKNMTNLPRILVVDDEPAIQRFLRTALDTGEFSLHQAENGHAALAAAVAVRPDVILLDLGLPDMDGVEVIRRVREWSQVPIIVLSVREREDDKVQALDAGADDYLAKPFGVAELVARIRVALRRSLQQAPEPVFRLGELEDEGRATHLHVSMGKRANVRMARDAARVAREILGANGVVDDYPVIRHMLNLEAVYTYEGTHEIHTLALGKAATGPDAFA